MSPADNHLLRDRAFAVVAKRAHAETMSRLQGTTGTHGLLLDAVGGFALQAPGLGRWVELEVGPQGGLAGPLRANASDLPFCDNSFGAVVMRHLAGAELSRPDLAQQAARVLAPHGVLIVIECHPYSAWRPWWAARRRRGEPHLRAVVPRAWQQALSRAGLSVGSPVRCGAPWPWAGSVPHWLGHACGDVWLLEARKHMDALLQQRMESRRTRTLAEQPTTWAPGAHRSGP